MTEPIRDLLDVKPPGSSVDKINALFYGEPGTGKTWLLGTAADHPATSPVLVIDIEGGVTTLRSRPDIDVVQVRTAKQLQDVQNAVAKDINRYYKSVCIDGLTELQKVDMGAVMKEQYNKKPDTTDIYVPSPREWGKSGERVRIIVRSFRDLYCHVFATALLAENTDDKTNITSMFPSLPGKLRAEIPGFFDIVGLLRAIDERGEAGTVNILRTLQLTKTDRVAAKDRTSSLGDLLKNPTIPDMWDKILASNVAPASPTAKGNTPKAA